MDEQKASNNLPTGLIASASPHENNSANAEPIDPAAADANLSPEEARIKHGPVWAGETRAGLKPVEKEVKYNYHTRLPMMLHRLKATLVISTYQAGKLVLVSAPEGELQVKFFSFDRPMGIAFSGNKLAVTSRHCVWLLRNAADVAAKIDPKVRYNACYLTRMAYLSGNIQGHEMAFFNDEIWVINTLFSCLCTISESHNFNPKWMPPFITGCVAEDRCHLNGMAIADGQIRFLSALGETDQKGGWRENKLTGGILMEYPSGRIVARGFAMPHSPRLHRGKLWLLNSGHGHLVTVNPLDGTFEKVAEVPGYARGMDFYDRFAFIGLSKIRETSTFGGMPIAEDRTKIRSGVSVVDTDQKQVVATFEFVNGVDEIFDVKILPGLPRINIFGPHPEIDKQPQIWTANEPPKRLS